VSRIALVTGSSRGIGKEIAKQLSTDFVSIVTGRSADTVNDTVREIKSNGGDAVGFIGDLTNTSEIGECFGFIDGLNGELELVVTNLGSGKSIGGSVVGVEEFKRVFELNFFSAVQVCEQAIERMKSGNIIAISSIAGCEVLGAPLAYNSAKAAIIAYMKSLSFLVARKGIRVNTISPGNVLFPGSTWDDKLTTSENETRKYIEQNVPLNAFATPEDIAEAIQFIVKSKFMVGSNLVIDGGQLKGW
jgi:3-oxoacyl-[acyl-carrier protein] reductase